MPEWLTWQAAGERFGLSADALRMRARRLGWRTQPGNDGKTLVMIPDEAAVQPRERSPERAPEQAASFARLTEILIAADSRAERADLRADKAEQRAEQAEQRADAAVVRADSADADRRVAEARAERERERADGAETRARTSDAAAEHARAEADRAKSAEVKVDELRAGQELMMDMHARALAEAQDQLERVREAAEGLREAEMERRARGLLARIRAAVWGE